MTSAAAYLPRESQSSDLVQILREHLDDFIERCQGPDPEWVLPAIVERQLRAIVSCGDFTAGFLRLECRACRAPRVVPFSCKSRLCPSCAGRRMNEQSAHLTDRVLPRKVPYRQWVLTLPWPLARRVAYDTALCRQVFGIFARVVGDWQCVQARAEGVAAPHAGCVLQIQRHTDTAQLFPHAHLVAPDGVFHQDDRGDVRFHRVRLPKHADILEIVTEVEARVLRLIDQRRQPDPPESTQLLLQCAGMEPVGVARLPERSAARRKARPKAASRLCARTAAGFDLHAAVRIAARDRSGLERLARYIARPPVAYGRVRRLPDGRVELRLKRARANGVRALHFHPVAFLARLAALLPPRRTHTLRFYGVFASHHRLRARVVPAPPCPKRTRRPCAPKRPARMGWADLLARVWKIDVLRCPRPACGGRLRIVCSIQSPGVVDAILAAVAVAEAEQHEHHAPSRAPPRAYPRASA